MNERATTIILKKAIQKRNDKKNKSKNGLKSDTKLKLSNREAIEKSRINNFVDHFANIF